MQLFLRILQLCGVACLVVLTCVVFYLLDKKTRFHAIKPLWKQVIYGVVFGGLSVMGTELGVSVNGVTLNVRDAAPLCAGLIFGAPAGIIAGVIGGVERYVAAYWGAGWYTQIACSVSTLLAGLFAAWLRHFMFDDKKPSWYYAFTTSFVMEVFHILMIFLTNMNDVHGAFVVVKAVAWPMIVVNTLAVTLAVLIVTLLGKEKLIEVNEQRRLAQSFQRWLLITVLIAFSATSVFTYFVQKRLSYSDSENVLRVNLSDVKADINDTTDREILSLTKDIRDSVAQESSYSNAQLATLADSSHYNVSEINLVNSQGKIKYYFTTNVIWDGSSPNYTDFDMYSGEQSAEFANAILDFGKESYVQAYEAISYDTTIYMKYAAYKLNLTTGELAGGFVQVGYNAARFQKEIADSVNDLTKNRHVGQDGYILIADSSFSLVSDPEGHKGENLSVSGLTIDSSIKESTTFQKTVYSTDCYGMYLTSEGYYLIAVRPVSEVNFATEVSVNVTIFMEVIVFASLFILVYFLIKRLVVDNISKINGALGEITGGNLNVSVNVRDNQEFASLSDDINSTVVTLKGYIKEAAARIDKELEFAKEIQLSALPLPLNGGERFSLKATMATAKEVGGDFYDYFQIDDNRLALVIADVSGKGIPAALFMMKSKTLIKSFAQEGNLSPKEILEKANAELAEGNEAEMFVTVWLGIYDFSKQILTTSNAGHEYPAIKSGDAPFSYYKDKHGFVLAGMATSRYQEAEIPLKPGDTIFVYTDGVTEATNAKNELFGDRRLLNALNGVIQPEPEALLDGVKSAIDAFVGSAPQFDDITMLSLKILPLKKKTSLTVDASLEKIDEVTDFANAFLEEIRCPAKAQSQLDVVIDEIFSNIANYAYPEKKGQAEVLLEQQGEAVVLTFKDSGIPYNPLEHSDPNVNAPLEEREVGGLGIFMVKKMSDSLTYAYEDGKNVLRIVKKFTA